MAGAAEALDKRWIALALLCVAQFVVVLDASIVNVALPTIGAALDFSEGKVEGFQSAFAVGAGFAILGLIATLVLIRTSDSRAHVALGQEAATASE